MGDDGNAARRIGKGATYVLELDGGVVNMKAAQPFVDALQNRIAG